MKRPIIGLSTYGVAHSEGFNIPAVYVQAVLRAGGVPVLLPSAGKDSVRQWMEIIQGLVLIGGGDIDPARYGASPHESIYNIDPDRDVCEFDLAERALGAKLPTLAICRGMQVVNVVLGGTLHRHVPEVFGEKVPHRLPPRETTRHKVEVKGDALIAQAMGSTQVSIVSWHHQAADRPGKGLRPVAWAEDGLIEAMEQEGNPNLLAVQWHPELSAADDPTQQGLFNHLVRLSCA